MLQGMQETYSTYLDSIQAALSSGSGGGGALASQTAAASAAEAAVNSDPRVGNGAASAISSPVQGPLPATPPGKVTPNHQQPPPQWVAGSPVAMQLWSRWFRDLAELSVLVLSLWLLRRALQDAAAGATAAAGSSGRGGLLAGPQRGVPAGLAVAAAAGDAGCCQPVTGISDQ